MCFVTVILFFMMDWQYFREDCLIRRIIFATDLAALRTGDHEHRSERCSFESAVSGAECNVEQAV
jgi:hypothetical protein